MMLNATLAKRWTPLIATVRISLALGVLLLVGAATADAEETRSIARASEPEPAPSESGVGPVEGIRVHGQWTIEVRDPDGTLVERREFENALVGSGEAALMNVLGRVWSIGGWRVVFPQAAGSICDDGAGGPFFCYIGENTDPDTNSWTFKTLTVGVSASQPYEVVLNGSLVAQRDGDITTVQTKNLMCEDNAVAPASCPGDPGAIVAHSMTSTTLATPVPVLNGQQVQVNVVISFS
jgi:hypothetical protein